MTERGDPTNVLPSDATNSLVMEVPDTHNKEHFCEPCNNKGHSNSPAEFWCDKMNSYFCSDCKLSLHDIIHDKCNVIRVSYTGSQSKHSTQRSPRCAKHNKKNDLFCEDHYSLSCSTCIAIDHRRCERVHTAVDFCEKLRKGFQFREMKLTLSAGINRLQTLMKYTKLHMQNCCSDRDKILSDLTDLRQEINAKFDELQEGLVKDLTEVYNDQKHSTDEHTKRCESMAMAMTTTDQLADTPSLLLDPPHTISVLLRGTAEVKSCESFLKDFETSYKPVRIKYKSTGVKDLKFDLGEILVEQVPIDPNQQTSKKPLRQRHLEKVVDMSVCFLSDKKSCNVTGISVMSNGRIILADSTNKKIKLVTDTGDLVDELSLSDEPSDLCRVDGATVAVSRPQSKMISLVNVTSSKLSLSSDSAVTTGKPCYGITYHDACYTVATGSKKPYEVYRVSQSGHEETLYNLKKYPSRIVYDPSVHNAVVTLCTSSPGDLAVCRISARAGITPIAHRGIIKGPEGVALDDDGNVYVCGSGSGNVVQMSSDGSMIKELLTVSDDRMIPKAIAVRDDTVVISFLHKDHVSLYRLV